MAHLIKEEPEAIKSIPVEWDTKDFDPTKRLVVNKRLTFLDGRVPLSFSTGSFSVVNIDIQNKKDFERCLFRLSPDLNNYTGYAISSMSMSDFLFNGESYISKFVFNFEDGTKLEDYMTVYVDKDKKYKTLVMKATIKEADDEF